MNIVIAIDFDGTCVTHDYPNIGTDIGAVPILKKLIKKGFKLVLHTMRSNMFNEPKSSSSKFDYNNNVPISEHLTDAVNWFKGHGIPLYGINNNPDQSRWTKSAKVYAVLYIDDAALGCPLKYDKTISDRPFVDWEKVEELLIDRGIL